MEEEEEDQREGKQANRQAGEVRWNFLQEERQKRNVKKNKEKIGDGDEKQKPDLIN
jgi:hypothetical protein